MRVSDYESFVAESDKFKDRPEDKRLAIALYGLAGEVGSVAAAIKKRLFSDREVDWRVTSEELEEEIGDAFWYCFQLAALLKPHRDTCILCLDIQNLVSEIGADDERARRIREVLTPERSGEFLKAALGFPCEASAITFNQYQALAFLTARTTDATLVEVCLAVLWQLNAELLRPRLPPIERELNKTLPDRKMNDVLGEIIWHLSALASIYALNLNDIVERNTKKVAARRNRDQRTLLHDREFKPAEQLPRHFEIAFVTLSKNRARMYYEGRRLGDPLTDNNYEDDGYRYHDVMHLANAAVLGWSPVLRKLLGKKRRSDPKIDEVEDGARAQIVEEAVIKAIHAEGTRLAREAGPLPEHARLFPDRNDISFRFLGLIRTFVSDLEAKDNLYWEWEDAIYIGHEMFQKLRQESQGTITVDLIEKSLKFRPDVCIDINGSVAAFGSAVVPLATAAVELRALLTQTEQDRADFTDEEKLRIQVVRKRAILDALGFGDQTDALCSSLDVTPLDPQRISVRGTENVAQILRQRNIVRFRTTLARSSTAIHCTALGVSDPIA